MTRQKSKSLQKWFNFNTICGLHFWALINETEMCSIWEKCFSNLIFSNELLSPYIWDIKIEDNISFMLIRLSQFRFHLQIQLQIYYNWIFKLISQSFKLVYCILSNEKRIFFFQLGSFPQIVHMTITKVFSCNIQ